MKSSLKHSATIEQFLYGEMLPAERENFEREVAADPELAEELKLSRFIESALQKEDILDIRKKILAAASKGTRNHLSETPVMKSLVIRHWFAAASVLLLAALGATLYFSVPKGDTNDALFSQYYSADNLINVTRAGDANIVEAVIKFQEEDYLSAAHLFGTILEKDGNNMACWFYYGISNIEIQDYTKAAEAFQQIITHEQNLYVDHAEWFLGLSYLKNDKIKDAKILFSKISKDLDNIHHEDARHMLEKLN